MIAIIDYKAGNLTSVKRAFDYLGANTIVTSDLKIIEDAEKIIFPGVGHAEKAMKVLTERKLDTAIKNAFLSGKPILGICLGTQIILSRSDEGNTDTLNIIKGKCPRFSFTNKEMKIPHMGWNEVNIIKQHPLFEGIRNNSEFYFVHSYYPVPDNEENIFATTEYEIVFPSAIGVKNLFATQFHPEKSGKVGLKLLSNFIKWNGKYA